MAQELLTIDQQHQRALVLREIDSTCQAGHGLQKPLDEEFLANINGIKEVCMAVLVAPTRISMTNLLKRFVRILRCYVDRGPADAAEAKVFVCQALFKFRNFHSMLLPENQGVYEYYEKMSDMVAILIDLEVLSNGSSCSVTLVNRVLTFLHLFFDDQAEYVLHTLLKLRCMTNTYFEIMNPILLKVLEDISRRPICVDIYLPFFLVSRLWLDNIKENNMKTVVISNANIILGEKIPANVLTFLENEIPSDDLSTDELMKRDFDIQKCCHQYLEHWKILNEDDIDEDGLEDESVRNDKKNSKTVSNERVTQNDKNIISHLNNSNQKSKLCKSKESVNDEIVVIDLTDDILEDADDTKALWTFSFDIRLENNLHDSFKLIEQKYRRTCRYQDGTTTTYYKDDATTKRAGGISSSVIENVNSSDGTVTRDRLVIAEENQVQNVLATVEEKCTVLSSEDRRITGRNSEDKRITGRNSEDKIVAASSVPKNVTSEDIETSSAYEDSKKPSLIEETVCNIEKGTLVKTLSLPNPGDQIMVTAEFDESSIVTHQDVVSEPSKEQTDNMDGLLLLASVSQTASRISIEPKNNMIKVKDYADLVGKASSQETKPILIRTASEPVNVNEVESSCHNAAFEAEKLNEISNDVDMSDVKNFTTFGLESTNAILNGETVVLRPKFPHSNLYVINKAIDTKNDGEEEMNELSRDELEKNCLTNCPNISKLCLSCQHICKSCGMSPLKTANSSRYVSCATCTYEVATYCRQCTYYLPKQENDIMRANPTISMMENGYEEKPLEAGMRYMPLRDKAACDKGAYEKVAYERDTYDRTTYGRDKYEKDSYEKTTFEKVTFEENADKAIAHKSVMEDSAKLDGLMEDSSTHENASKLPFKKRLKFDSSLNMRKNQSELTNEANMMKSIRLCNKANIRHNMGPNVQLNKKPFVHSQPIVHKNHQPWVKYSADLKVSNELQTVPSNVHSTHQSWIQHSEFKIPKNVHPSNHQIHMNNWIQSKNNTVSWNSVQVPSSEKPVKKMKRTSRAKKSNDPEVRSSARISKRNIRKIDYTYSDDSEPPEIRSPKRRRKRAMINYE